jgi:hypothetical protein
MLTFTDNSYVINLLVSIDFHQLQEIWLIFNKESWIGLIGSHFCSFSSTISGKNSLLCGSSSKEELQIVALELFVTYYKSSKFVLVKK